MRKGLAIPLRRCALIAPLTLAAACNGQLDHLGKPPGMTAPGAPQAAIAPLSPTRAALSRPIPAPPPEDYAVASLWRSGPTSLFGDRRARGRAGGHGTGDGSIAIEGEAMSHKHLRLCSAPLSA